MTQTSDNANSSCSASGQAKCAPVGLLLFVGFIFGFSVGFGTHDFIYKTLSKAMYSNNAIMSEPIEGFSIDKQGDEEGEPTNETSQEEKQPVEEQPE